MKLKLSILLLCVCLFSCKKKVDENYRPEFVGDWHCPIGEPSNNDFGFDLSIDNNGNAHYTEYSWDGDRDHINGKVRANNHHLKIGRVYSFKIKNIPPELTPILLKSIHMPMMAHIL